MYVCMYVNMYITRQNSKTQTIVKEKFKFNVPHVWNNFCYTLASLTVYDLLHDAVSASIYDGQSKSSRNGGIAL
jgi:hypothetical protein